MIRQTFLFLALMGTVGCGPITKSKTKRSKVYGEKSVGIPVALSVSQKQCISSSSASEFEIDVFTRGRFHSQATSLSTPIKAVNEIEFSGYFLGATQWELLNNPVIEREAQKFELCEIEGKYEENTYQDATLSILSPIKNFENRFESFVTNLELSPIKIRTAPLLKEGNKFLINNAFYYSRTKEITFLPQGYYDEENLVLPLGGRPFWKYPMVALHEYGHHVFVETYLKYAQKNSNLPPLEDESNEVSLCIDNSNTFGETHSAEEVRKVNTSLAVSALNEGFADIFSYFGEPAGRKLFGMGCMTKSRDVEYGEFFDGSPKVLTSEAIKYFLSEEPMNYTNCSEMTNFQDPHLIGAVFARAIYQATYLKAFNDEQKLSIVVEWLNRLIPLFGKYNDPETILKLAVTELHEVFKSNMVFGQNECYRFYSHFTGLTRSRCL